ncbi:MAG: hypothetical protein R2741_09385 [Methanolobus sp.]
MYLTSGAEATVRVVDGVIIKEKVAKNYRLRNLMKGSKRKNKSRGKAPF